jgi:hypothetical protein
MTNFKRLSANGVIENGIDLDMMNKVFKKINEFGFKTMDSLIDFTCVELDNWDVMDVIHVIEINVTKNKKLILLKPGSMAKIVNVKTNKTLFLGISIDNELICEDTASEVLYLQNKAVESFLINEDTLEGLFNR